MTENNSNQNQIEWNFKSSSNWATGVALIIVGGLFLLNSLGIINVYLMNWWAVFILIPGINMAFNGWQKYNESKSRVGLNTGLAGLGLILIALAFFFNVSWYLLFPVVLIGTGVYLLLMQR